MIRMIKCPAEKVEASPGYDRSNEGLFSGENGPANGFVSWEHCIECSHSKGFNEATLIVRCGWGAEVVELLSVPL